MTGITAGILAGGRSSRFGSDKAWAMYAGRPLISHLLESVRPQVDDVLISANTNVPRYAGLGWPVIADLAGAGPLAGIAALLSATTRPWLLVVPCDALTVPPDWVRQCLRAAESQPGSTAVLLDDGEQLHPTFSLLRAELAESARQALNSGQFRLQRWMRGHSPVRVRGPAPRNINTPAELRTL